MSNLVEIIDVLEDCIIPAAKNIIKKHALNLEFDIELLRSSVLAASKRNAELLDHKVSVGEISFSKAVDENIEFMCNYAQGYVNDLLRG